MQEFYKVIDGVYTLVKIDNDRDIAKKPVLVDENRNPVLFSSPFPFDFGNAFICPICETILAYCNNDMTPYCAWCGQKLNWEEFYEIF